MSHFSSRIATPSCIVLESSTQCVARDVGNYEVFFSSRIATPSCIVLESSTQCVVRDVGNYEVSHGNAKLNVYKGYVYTDNVLPFSCVHSEKTKATFD